ncbi:MAG: hypothetical protein FWE88_08625 [Phycisphaerae bacterium]|nr:hypothetical protein [Phycisphaerae bacterium]
MNAIAAPDNPVPSRRAAWWPYLFVAAGFLWCFTHFPGAWYPDTEAQHEQMLSGQYRDWHPPVFAAFWGLVNTAWNTATGMEITGSEVLYVVHAVMLWGGLALLVHAGRGFFGRLYVDPARWRLWFVGALLFLALFEMTDITRDVLKDTAMFASYVLAVGVLCNFPRRMVWKLLAGAFCMLLLFYGTAVRHNAVFAVLPLLYLLAANYAPSPSHSTSPKCSQPSSRSAWPWRLMGASLLLWGLLLLGIYGMNYGVLKSARQNSMQEIYYGDIWRLNYATQTFDLPPSPKGVGWEPLTEDVFFALYQPRPFVKDAFAEINAHYNEPESRLRRYYLQDFSGAEEEYRLLAQAWQSKVWQNPLLYIKLKGKLFGSLLRYMSFMELTGVWYLAFAVVVSGVWVVRLVARRPLGDVTPWCVTISGLLYVLPYLIFLTDIQRRYLIWFFFASLFGAVWFAGVAYVKYATRGRNRHAELPAAHAMA